MANDLYHLLTLPSEHGSHADCDDDGKNLPDNGTVTGNIETADNDRAAILLGGLSV
jgi:hypothetical protein